MSGGQKTPHGMHLPRGFLMKGVKKLTVFVGELVRGDSKMVSLNQLQEVIRFVEVDFSGT